MSPGPRAAAALAITTAMAIYLLRCGVRGARSSLVLGRALHLSARSPAGRYLAGLHALVYRRTGGRVLNRWFGNPVLVIETIGRRSGERRTTPIAYLRRGHEWVVIPINAGSERTPSWWLNLAAAGHGLAHIGGRSYAVRPRVTSGEERERLWRAYARQAPMMPHYRRLTTRQVPVVVLERVH